MNCNQIARGKDAIVYECDSCTPDVLLPLLSDTGVIPTDGGYFEVRIEDDKLVAERYDRNLRSEVIMEARRKRGACRATVRMFDGVYADESVLRALGETITNELQLLMRVACKYRGVHRVTLYQNTVEVARLIHDGVRSAVSIGYIDCSLEAGAEAHGSSCTPYVTIYNGGVDVDVCIENMVDLFKSLPASVLFKFASLLVPVYALLAQGVTLPPVSSRGCHIALRDGRMLFECNECTLKAKYGIDGGIDAYLENCRLEDLARILPVFESAVAELIARNLGAFYAANIAFA